MTPSMLMIGQHGAAVCIQVSVAVGAVKSRLPKEVSLLKSWVFAQVSA